MKKISILFLVLFLYPFAIEAKDIIVPLNESAIQGAINAANNGGKIIIQKGEYFSNESILIKGKNNLFIIAKGNVTITNKRLPAIIIEDSNVSIKGINFFRNETAIFISSSVLSTTKCGFEKNKVGIKVFDSTLVADSCYFKINYLGGILLIGEQNVVKVPPSNFWKDNYVSIFPYSASPISEGNKILLGSLND